MRIDSVLMIGAGGIGTHFAPLAYRILSHHKDGTKYMTIVDGDAYEPKNLERQAVGWGSVAENKAAALACRMRDDFAIPETARHPKDPFVAQVTNYVRDSDEAAALMLSCGQAHVDGALVVALCVDNDKTRKMFYLGARKIQRAVILIDMGNEFDTASSVLSLWFDGKCSGVSPDEVFENLISPGDRAPGGGCQALAPSTPQLLTANLLAATMGIMQLQAVLDDQPIPSMLRACLFNQDNPMSVTGSWIHLPKAEKVAT